MKQKPHPWLRPRLSSIFAQHLFCAFHLPGRQRIVIAEKPGAWMDAEGLEAWSEPCKAIARESLSGAEMDYGVFSAERAFWDSSILTLIEDRDTGKPLAFNVMRLLPVEIAGRQEEVLHLGLTMVSPEARGRSLSSSLYILTCVLFFFRRQCRPIWISSVSQVPAVIGMVAETFVDVFPTHEDGTLPPPRHLNLATQIMDHHRHTFGVSNDAPFVPETFVIQDAYRGGSDNLKKSFEQATQHRLERYNLACSESLDYGRGDDFLQIGRANAEAARRILRKRLPEMNSIALSLQLASLFLSSLVAPIAQWLKPSRAQGDLRARESS